MIVFWESMQVSLAFHSAHSDDYYYLCHESLFMCFTWIKIIIVHSVTNERHPLSLALIWQMTRLMWIISRLVKIWMLKIKNGKMTQFKKFISKHKNQLKSALIKKVNLRINHLFNSNASKCLKIE